MTPSTTVDAAKDIKVRIPVSYHIQLRTLKIVRGKSMSDALAEALDLYFATDENRAVEAEGRAASRQA